MGELLVSLPEIVALLRRHVLAVLLVLMVSAGVEYSVKHSPPTYAESGTMVVLLSPTKTSPNPYESVRSSLIQDASIAASDIMSPAGQQRIRDDGGTAQVDVELVNFYDLEYPNFDEPYLTVITTSTDPNAVHNTFAVVTRMLSKEATAQRVVTGDLRTFTLVAGDTGPLELGGSSKRTLGALAVLTLIAMFAVASFLDRHPIRPFRRLLGREPAGKPGHSAARKPVSRPVMGQPGAAFRD